MNCFLQEQLLAPAIIENMWVLCDSTAPAPSPRLYYHFCSSQMCVRKHIHGTVLIFEMPVIIPSITPVIEFELLRVIQWDYIHI